MVCIVVPAFNEENNIGRVLRDLFTLADKLGNLEIVVVDDGSSDNTCSIAKAEGVKVLRHKINRGQGAALETGNVYARQSGAEFTVHFDGDGQFRAADILPALLYLKQNNLAVVLGSRFLSKQSNLPWSKRYLIFPLARVLTYLFAAVRLTDPQNGFRIMSRAALEELVIINDGMAHNSEIIKQIKTAGLNFAEVPVEVIYRSYGLGLRGGLKIFWDLFFSIFAKKQK